MGSYDFVVLKLDDSAVPKPHLPFLDLEASGVDNVKVGSRHQSHSRELLFICVFVSLYSGTTATATDRILPWSRGPTKREWACFAG